MEKGEQKMNEASQLSSAADLIANLRTELQPLMDSIRNHPYLDALEEGRVPRESLRAFAAQQYHIVTNGIMNIALITARFGNLASRERLNFFLQAEFEVNRAVLEFARALHMSESDLKAAPLLAAALPFSYFETYLCFYRSDAELITAFFFDAEVWISNARRVGRALRERYGFDDEAVRFFEMYANYQAAEGQVLPPVQAALERGVTAADIRQSTRLLLEYEKMFWDAMASAAGL
jgi:thiaminase